MNTGNKLRAGLLAGLVAFSAACSNNAARDEEIDEDLIAFGLLQESQVQTGRAITTDDIDRAFIALDDGSFTYDDDIVITAHDGTEIAANIYLPAEIVPGQKLPGIVFINSWAMDEYEYKVQAAIFARKGYAVLSYSTRGFGESGGQINVAGPKDMDDLGVILDWFEANAPVDANNIGAAGISYGAGISLLAAANHDRIKTAAALSGWAKLSESLYGGQTPRQVWGSILLLSGYFTGNMDPIIQQQWNRLISYNDIPEVLAWADDRSPLTVIDSINAASKPIYISNNFSDNLFAPNPTIRFFEQLTGPKKLDLNQGIHATAEVGGLIGAPNYVWQNVHRWFDQHLRGDDTGIMNEPVVTMEKKLDTGRVAFTSWPAPELGERTFYLKPRGWFSDGKLKTSPNTSSGTSKIYSGVDTVATSGIPLLSPILESHIDLAVKAVIGWISRVNGVLYKSDSFASGLKIRGPGRLSVRVTPSRPQANLNVYLYDVDRWGIGTLITTGTASVHEAVPGRETTIDVDLSAVAYDLPAGHKIALAVDTFDPQFAVPTLWPYSVKFHHSSAKQSTLRLSAED